MKFEEALYFKHDQKFALRTGEISKPLHEKHLLINPLWVGICGSDLVAIEMNIAETLSLGHEWVGQIAEIGSAVTTFKPGDIVTSTVLIKCGYCKNCVEQRTECLNQFYLAPDAGMLRTVAELPEASLVKLPSDVSPDSTLLEIIAVAENVHTQLLPYLKADKKILVIGAGSLGISVALTFAHYGYSVEVMEVIKSRIARARTLGISCTNLAQMLLDPDKKGHYEIIIDASGDHLGGKGGWNYLEHFGSKQFMGVILAKYSKDISLKATLYFLKNATLKWIQGCTKESLDLAIKNWAPRIKNLGQHMISHIYDYADVNQAFTTAKDRENSGRVVIKVQDKK